MKKNFTMLFALLIMVLIPTEVTFALSSEIHVTRDGKATVSGAKVMQIAGSTFFARLYWGDAFVRITIKASPASTNFFRATGESTTIAEMHLGDLLDVSGELQSGSDVLSLVATSVRNSSVQKERSTLSGVVTGIDLSARKFTINDEERGLATIRVATTTQFFKGTRILDLEHLRVGDLITKTSGDYDIPSKTLSAQSVTIFLDLTLYKPRLFIGKLAETPALTNINSIKVTANGALFTVNLGGNTVIMRNNRSTTTLQRFVAGDSIRLYGTRLEADEPIIDAEVVRNMNI